MNKSVEAEAASEGYSDPCDGQDEAKHVPWSRTTTVVRLQELGAARRAGTSERDFEKATGTPRSTFRYWERRRNAVDSPPAVAQFFESPEGLAVLHRVVAAAQFVLNLRSPDGIRLVCEFLHQSGLDEFVGSSFGSVQKATRRMQSEVLAYGIAQREALGRAMQPKEITVCEDETFHPEICLVAIEPASGFILLEQYAERRDAETWNEAMKEAMKGLPVKVIQSTADEAKALLAHAQEAFEAPHSPDVFHVQYELSRSISAPLARRVRQAEAGVEAAVVAWEKLNIERATYEAERQGPGRRRDYESRVNDAQEAIKVAERKVEEAKENQNAAREAVAGISADYHPFRLSDGAGQSSGAVSKALESRFAAIETIATKADLPERSPAGIAKARRVLPAMAAAIQFTHKTIAAQVAALQLPSPLRREVIERLVPGLYLERAASRAPTAEKRRAGESKAEILLSPLRDRSHPLQLVPQEERAKIETVARGSAEVFQRSSSCVEGRNGQLSLFHHGLHRLRPEKLAALTVIHNYFVRRVDGTTAAERFFGSPPDDLFEHLVAKMPSPPRPAQKRAVPHLRSRPVLVEPLPAEAA